jgi:hypothetical protein
MRCNAAARSRERGLEIFGIRKPVQGSATPDGSLVK